MTLPTIITKAGLQPQSPADLLAQIVAAVSVTSPGYTSVLPASLVDDVLGTEVASVAQCDSARVEAVNSLTPYGANAFLLNQLGQVYGVQQGTATNTSALVVFTSVGNPGLVIPPGFVVSDGTHQYVLQDGTILNAAGVSAPALVVANTTGTWTVPANTVTTVVTNTISLSITVTNPTAGTPGASDQTEEDYRAAVLNAGLCTTMGTPTLIQKNLTNQAAVPGVQTRLVAVQQSTDATGSLLPSWKVFVGGGDPKQIAYAIYRAVFDSSTLAGSVVRAVTFTNANPGAVTTNVNHGFTTGQVKTVSGSSPATFNGSYTITVTGPRSFTVGTNTTGFGAYVASTAIFAPNPKNITAQIVDQPNSFFITYVVPPQQIVTISLLWNTTNLLFLSAATVNSLGQAALVAYVNGIVVGQPMNLFEMQATFQNAVADVLDPNLITRMVFTVSIDGVVTAPAAGTGIIAGDPESYLFTSTPSVTVAQG